MEVSLLVAKGKGAGRVVPVTGPKFFIGRAPDCQLRPASKLVSRHHCAILKGEDAVAVRDFGSTNGTLVNGEKIRGELQLNNGDRLVVGRLEFEVRLVAEAAPETKPKPEGVPKAAVPAPAPALDDDLDLAEWLGGMDVPPAAEPDAETETADAAGAESAVPGETSAGEPEGSQDQPVRDVSEEQKEEMRRRREIPGVSKAAQAKRVTETPQDAAADALRKLHR